MSLPESAEWERLERRKSLSCLLKELQEQGDLSEREVQDLLATAIRVYAAHYEKDDRYPPFSPESKISATEVMILASQMLKYTNVELFELGLWMNWNR